LVEFLKRTPLNKSVHKVLNSINLSGKVDGDMRLVLPLDERESILDIDLNLKDNRLSVLDDKIVIKGYNSLFIWKNCHITLN
jgi:uncharacterized protein YhdP